MIIVVGMEDGEQLSFSIQDRQKAAEILEALKGNDSKYVTVTFDDGELSIRTEAVHWIRATVTET